jgi:hypothetical protein
VIRCSRPCATAGTPPSTPTPTVHSRLAPSQRRSARLDSAWPSGSDLDDAVGAETVGTQSVASDSTTDFARRPPSVEVHGDAVA